MAPEPLRAAETITQQSFHEGRTIVLGRRGPSVQILEHSDFRCRKGDLCVYTDRRIRNPTDHAL